MKKWAANEATLFTKAFEEVETADLVGRRKLVPGRSRYMLLTLRDHCVATRGQ